MPDIVTDELLMAFADGELDAAERSRLERALADNPALRARLRIFEHTGRSLGEAFETASRPIPAFLLDERRERSIFHDAADGMLSAIQRWFATPARGLAFAAVALLIGFSAAMFWQGAWRQSGAVIYAENGLLRAGGALQTALEATPSQGFDAQQGGGAVAVVQSFVDLEGHFCREYLTRPASGHGVACRAGDGRWAVMVHVTEGGEPKQAADFRPAGAEQNQLIDGYVHQIMKGDALPPDVEQAALASHWSSPR